ncbi:MAG TPA: tRNA (guanosine(37)-N1)-methyltransferase TrmD [Verrucomicrobiae bacterium]|nr:tRNA (guanosine(37)-N1)-methyltransferase TrmD [Verrucomicrobiae bacterium]
MRFDILTLFPDMFAGTLGASILKRAQEAGHLEVHLHDIRAVATDNHKTVDDTPYGGGAGMVLKVDVVAAALEKVEAELGHIPAEKRKKVMLCAQGKRFTQPIARQIAEDYDQITLLCGHYEGFDERIRGMVDAELSIGDFVLTGGELPAMMVVDAVARLIPQVIREESPEEESFSLMDSDGTPLLEYPQYTRPLEFNGEKVPDILLSGNHAEIAKWRLAEARERTRRRKEDTREAL